MDPQKIHPDKICEIDIFNEEAKLLNMMPSKEKINVFIFW